VVIVLGGGLLCSTGLVLAVEHQQQAHLSQLMDQRAQAVGKAVTGEVNRYTDTISDLAVAVGAQSDLSADDFAALTSRLNRQRLPGVTGAALVVPATEQQIPQVQRHWREAGNSTLTLSPFGFAREHLFAVLSRSLDGRSATPTGRDLTQADEPTQALLLARERGQAGASGTYVLQKDTPLPVAQQQLSFVLVTPVYGGAGTTDAGQFRGWILIGLRSGDFLVETMAQASQSTVAVTLLDASVPGTKPVPVARTGAAALTHHAALQRVVPINVAGRSWRITVQPTRGMTLAAGPSRTLEAGAGGVVVTLLLTALVGALSTSRTRALIKVEHATRVLHADIQRREVVEAELREREFELQAFTGVVAHDLKAPLARLIGYSDILTEEHGDSLEEAAEGYVRRISHNAGRMLTLIDDLLSYTAARDSTLVRQRVDLGELLDEVIAERSDGLADPAHIEADPLPVVEADPVLLRQVFDNLIGNAIKYVRPGDIPDIRVRAVLSSADWTIEISDRGIGIDDADQPAVFGAFHRARGSKEYPGTGLGLAICQKIIQRHDGEIGVSVNPGGGSRFWFSLPAPDPQAVIPAQHRSHNEPSLQEAP